MPRRRGIFGRIADWFRGAPEPVYEPPPTPEPPLKPLPPREPEHDRRMKEIFEDVTDDASRINYDEWLETWGAIGSVYNYIDDEDERNEAEEEGWEEYLRAYYLTSDEPGAVSREQFHQDTNIPRSQVDWGLWKQIKRGTP
jgi:hypothetical protein